MSGIALSSSVRQNLLSLQSTASLLATTQNDLATGNKVNSALDNPTEFFTAQGLNDRASDIGNLLDGIGNGVQVLQAANTGITSLQSLISNAQSIANQVEQQPVGFSTLASATTAAPTGAGALGVAGSATDLTNGGTNSLNGETLIFTPPTGSSAQALTITISSTPAASTATTATVNSIADLNTALQNQGIGITATLSSTGSITLASSNNNASQSLSTSATPAANTVGITGTDTATLVGTGVPTPDAASQASRANLVQQYNQVLQQINTTAQDSSFNGINLLNGDTLNLTFDETGASKLAVTGVTFNATGLGLSTLTAGTDFQDTNSAQTVLNSLTAANTTLRTEASALGSNLSIVQVRQDFNKNLINVLQTGASNLTLADSNELAADSQALSTRQSIAVSALSLANQSQESVLQLLR